MKKMTAFIAVAALALSACGGSGSSGGGGGGGSSDLANASTVAVTGVTVDPAFATNGQFTVGFVATDASGAPILASASADVDIISVKMFGNWKNALYKAAGDITCSITASDAGSYTCAFSSVTSTTPSGGSGNVAGSVLIDDSGSMSGSDPNDERDPAADAFLDSICSDMTNMFGVFDFGAGSNLAFTDTRDLMTANGVTDAQLTGTGSALPFATCETNNVDLAKQAITDQVQASGGTPLWESVLELCTEMATKNAAGGQLENKALAMLVLSDGEPDSDTNQAAAEACVTNNGITTCTVGLGPGSELACNCTTNQDCIDAGFGDTCSGGLCADSTQACTTDAECFGTTCLAAGICESWACQPDPVAVAALKSLAQAGNCVYAAAADAAALQPIFGAIGTAVSSGQNLATFALNPVPATGVTIDGQLLLEKTDGTFATANFSFVCP